MSRSPAVQTQRTERQEPPRARRLPENPTSEQRVFIEKLVALLPTITGRVQQCVDDSRVALRRAPEVRVQLAAETPDGAEEVSCQARLLENGATDVYVRACIEDVLEELECPEPTRGAVGASLETALKLRAARGLR